MSTKFKNKILLSLCMIVILNANSQNYVTIELPRTGTPVSSTLGPVYSNLSTINMMKDPNNNGANFIALTGNEVTTATFKLLNQQYTGLTYSGLSSGLAFGAGPTTAVALPPDLPGQQTVSIGNVYPNLGYFDVAPGGPTDNFYSSTPAILGSGIVTGVGGGNITKHNGAASIFTAAQVQYDQGIQNNPTPVPTAYNAATSYYYGDLVIEFNRFIQNPVIHIAGLGGSYNYVPVGVTPASNPDNWKRTYFSVELSTTYPLTKLSGNAFFDVTGGKISNNKAKPDGASVSTTLPNPLDPFDHLGAASGSVRLNGLYKTIVLKVFLRGANITDVTKEFAWSAPGSASNNDPGTLRNPLTGDVWLVSVSTEPPQLIPLPSTGVHLTGALNGNDVQLSWKTQTEINSDNFEIERSIDGTNFTAIGNKAAAGNSATEKSYDFTDANMSASIYYYRLRLNDIDARYSYSNIVSIRKAGTIKDIRIYPNPATDNVSLEFTNSKGNYSIRLYNQAGQEVMNKVANVQYNVQTVAIERNNLPAGYYMMQIRNNNDGSVRSEKVIFQ